MVGTHSRSTEYTDRNEGCRPEIPLVGTMTTINRGHQAIAFVLRLTAAQEGSFISKSSRYDYQQEQSTYKSSSEYYNGSENSASRSYRSSDDPESACFGVNPGSGSGQLSNRILYDALRPSISLARVIQSFCRCCLLLPIALLEQPSSRYSAFPSTHTHPLSLSLSLSLSRSFSHSLTHTHAYEVRGRLTEMTGPLHVP